MEPVVLTPDEQSEWNPATNSSMRPTVQLPDEKLKQTLTNQEIDDELLDERISPKKEGEAMLRVAKPAEYYTDIRESSEPHFAETVFSKLELNDTDLDKGPEPIRPMVSTYMMGRNEPIKEELLEQSSLVSNNSFKVTVNSIKDDNKQSGPATNTNISTKLSKDNVETKRDDSLNRSEQVDGKLTDRISQGHSSIYYEYITLEKKHLDTSPPALPSARRFSVHSLGQRKKST